MSTDLVDMMTPAQARVATERIRSTLDRVSTAWAELSERIADAYRRRADLALGYGSWAEYAQAELQPPSALAADVRRELVSLLSAAGMSTRAIAPTVGVTQRQVSTDVRRGFSPDVGAVPQDRQLGSDYPPAIEVTGDQGGPRGGALATPAGTVIAHWNHVDPATGNTLDHDTVTVTGLDGKTYPRPTTPAPVTRRRPWPAAADDAAARLDKVITTIRNLARDDRFPTYKDEAPRFRKSLAEAIDALQRVHDELTKGV